ncbi:MAG TPA: hypothetical protein VJ397_06895 [Thermoplasmata archaeon]|nr:hypothetical protein [Thermoplasmata archaeon]
MVTPVFPMKRNAWQRWRLRTDRGGGIEGMPLQLLIMVIVAGLALAVILGWVLSVPQPSVIKTVSPNHTTVAIANAPVDSTAKKSLAFTVAVFDASNGPVKNVVVTLDGALTAGQVTKADADDGTVDGVVSFGQVEFKLPPGASTGTVQVTAFKTGHTAPAPVEVLVYRA